MKIDFKKLFLLPTLIAGLGLFLANRASAQTFTVLHSFPDHTNGSIPRGRLLLSGNTLYGPTTFGGSSLAGVVFAVNIDGTGFTNLHNFAALADGQSPFAGMDLAGSTLYGAAFRGGSFDAGTLYSINTDGTGFTKLHTFGSGTGSFPFGGVIVTNNMLFGATFGGGIIYRINTDGTGFTNLHSLIGSEGGSPVGGLILSGNTLYGTARDGGAQGSGTIFKVNTDGSGFATIYNFPALSSNTNSEGANPQCGLILSGNTLYGVATKGGSSGDGTVFAVSTNGTGFTNLHSLLGTADGMDPRGALTLESSTLYGTARAGGSSGNGTVFKVNVDGSGFETLHHFSALISSTNSDGANLIAGLIYSANTLYGVADSGGSSGKGTIFSISLPPPPQLNIAATGNQSILFWPASATNYILQSTTNLDSGNWATATDAIPVIAVTVTNTSPTRFFRLVQP